MFNSTKQRMWVAFAGGLLFQVLTIFADSPVSNQEAIALFEHIAQVQKAQEKAIRSMEGKFEVRIDAGERSGVHNIQFGYEGVKRYQNVTSGDDGSRSMAFRGI